jgi:ATP-dependent helicase/nuclease subunit A
MRVLVNWPGETATPVSFVFLASESRPAPSAAEAFEDEVKARRREELNALYVAMTRARELLVVSSSQSRTSSAESWWQRMLPVSELDSRLRGNDGVGADERAWVKADVPARIDLLVLPCLENNKNTENSVSNMPVASVFAAQAAIDNVANSSLESRIGQAMHRLLQRDDLNAVDAVALEFNLSSEEAKQAAQMAQRIVAGEGAWAWDETIVSWQGNEIELTANGKLMRLDRLVRRTDTGEWWVLDYKSESQPQNKPELVAQMRAYIAAVKACYAGEPVKAAFLTATGKMIEIV